MRPPDWMRGRRAKIIAITLVDCGLVAPAIVVSLSLRLSEWWPEAHVADAVPYTIVLTLSAIPLSHALGIPRSVMRMFDAGALRDLFLLALGLAAMMTVLRFAVGLPLPRSLPGIFLVVYFMALVFLRLVYLALYERSGIGGARRNVLIYGAGATGRQLFNALRQDTRHRVVGFVDDSAKLHGMRLGGCKVYDPARIEEIVRRRRVDRIVLAMPGAARQRRIELANELINLPCEVMTLPPIDALLSGRADFDQLKTVTLDSLLGREAVRIDLPEVQTTFRGRTALVTGAGGSIGSELCRQIVDLGIGRLVMLDSSEYALYRIEHELRRKGGSVVLTPVLGSVLNEPLLIELMSEHGVDVVLHAAAYKHVPLVEANDVEGVRNNVLGTATAARAAARCGVERFILVSTDKAVRPTNVMGASKRMAELIVQELQDKGRGTIFSLVRFGNVIGSSGSVIPLFRDQIDRGGPITVTHPDVTRYFMTIAEAAQLVLIAAAISRGGEVFVLDMGEPVRIIDLARSMVRLSGRTVREKGQDNGDIAIDVIGLRPGEKLHEELLIGRRTLPTPHPKIMVAEEAMPGGCDLAAQLQDLEDAISARDGGAIRCILGNVVEGYDAGSDAIREAG